MNAGHDDKNNAKYDEIINMEYKGSKRKNKMSREGRAAQFAPFAALTGFDDAIREAGKGFVAFLVASAVILSLLGGALGGGRKSISADSEEPFFTDVIDSGKFWFEPVYWGASNGIVMGYNDGTFGPGKQCTRAQMVTFIWRLAGKPEPSNKDNPFSDVKSSDYYYKACLWGSENGIVMGYNDGTFRPGNRCLRNQAVTFLWRFAGCPEPSSAESPFKDVKESDYFYKAVLWGSEMKIVAGYPEEGLFKPKGDCLRRQMVTFLHKFAKLALDGKIKTILSAAGLKADGSYNKDLMDDARNVEAPKMSSSMSVQNGLKIFWKAVDGYEVRYNVYRKTGSGEWKKIAEVTGTSYVDKDAKEETSYSYKVTATVCKGTESKDSNVLADVVYDKVNSYYSGFTDYCIGLMDTKGNDYSDGHTLVKYYEKPYLITDENGSFAGDGGVFMYRSKVVPYKTGASLSGMDCLGLQTFLARSYFKINLTQSRSQYKAGREISIDELRPGDLLCADPGYNPDHGYTYMYCGKDPDTGYDLVMTTNKRHGKLYMLYFDVAKFVADDDKCLRRITK